MGFSLKKLLEGAAAQVNMNDGGKTFATVVRNQPVQSQPAKTPPPSYGSNPVKQAINRTRDVFDANTPQDRFKRQLAQKPVIDFTAQDRARQTVNGVKNVAGNYAKGFVESYNQVGTGLGTLLAQNSADVKNAQKAQNNLADQLHQQRMTAIKTAKNPNLNDVQRNRLNNYYNSLDRADVDLQNSRTQQSNDLYSKLDPKKNLAAIGSVGFDIATLGVGTGGTQAVKQAFKSGIKTGAKELGGQMVKTGSLGAVSGGLSPIVQKGDQATAKDILQGAGMGFAMGAALPAVAPAVKFGGSKVVNTVKGLTKENIGAITPRLNQAGFIRVPGRDTELMVTHNLSADNLAHAQELGGLPQPSIGIVDPRETAIDGFGEITLVGNNRLVDPAISGTRTFGADVYSPRQPKGVLKRNAETQQRLMQKFEPAMKKYTGSKYLNLDSADSIDEALRNETSVMAQFLEDNKIKPKQAKLEINSNTLREQMRNAGLSQQERAQFVVNNIDKLGKLDDVAQTKAFLESKGIKPKAALNRADDRYTFSRQIRDAGLQDNFDKYVKDIASEAGATNKIFAGYTPSGTPRWLDENMDNVLKTMRKEKLRAGEGGFFGSGDGATNAKLTKEYRSIDQIVNDKNRLVSSDKMEKVKEAISSKRESIQKELEPLAKHQSDNQFTEYDNQMEAINDYLAGDKAWFHEKFPGAPDSVIKKLDKLREDIKNTPTEYFESVSDRAVKLNEFEKALIPEGLPKAQSEAIVNKLRAEGIQPRFYKAGERQQALIDLMEEDNLSRKPKELAAVGGNPFKDQVGAIGRNRINEMNIAKGESFNTMYQYTKPVENKNNPPFTNVADKSTRRNKVGGYTSNIPEKSENVNPIRGLDRFKTDQKGFARSTEESPVLKKLGIVKDGKAMSVEPKSAPIEKTPTQTPIGPVSKVEKSGTPVQSPELGTQKMQQTQPSLSQATGKVDDLATGKQVSGSGRLGATAQNQTNLEPDNTYTSTKQQRGFKSNIAKDTNTPLSVYKDIPGYNVKPNAKTIGSAAQRVAKDPEGTYNRLLENGIQKTDDSADALVLLRNLVENDELDKASKLAKATAKAGTDFGQAVQIFSAFRKTTPDGALRDSWNIVNAYNAKHPKKSPIRITPEQTKKITDLANDLQNTEYGTREWAKKAALLEREKGLLTPNSFLSKVSTVQTMAQLLNPKTAIRNILGNGVLDLAEDLSRLPAAGIDKALKGLGLIDERNMVVPNMKTNWANKLIGFKQGVEDVNLGIRTTGAAGNYDLTKEVFKPGSVGNKLEKLLGYELSSMDKAFFTGRYQSSLENMMKAQKVKVPTPEMKATAEAEALYATFQNNSNLSKALQKGKNAANFGKEWGLGDFILKYPKTPGNIVNVGLDYSPVGFFKGLKSLNDGIKLKNIQNIRNGELLLGRSLVGSGLIAGGAFLAKQGIISGKQDGDFDKSAADRELGKGPFTFNITALGRLLKGEDPKARPGDITANYDWLQPNAIQLSMGANMVINNNSATQQINANLESLGAGIDTISEQPVFRGVKDFVGDLNSQQGGGVGKAMQNVATSAFSSFVPSLVNQVGQQFDNTKRSSYSNTPVGEAINRSKARIPGARNTLYPSLNTLGEEQKQYDVGGNNPFNVFFNPAFLNRVKDSPALSLADDLNQKTGETSQYPRSLTGNQIIDGVKTKLTPGQLFDLKKNVGQTTKNIFNQFASNPAFNAKSDTEKVNLLSGALTDINAAGKAQLAAKNSLGQFAPGFTGKPTKLDTGAKKILSDNYDINSKIAGKDLPKNLRPEAVNVIANYTAENAKQPSNDKAVKEALKAWNNGNDLPLVTNEVAKQWAEYERKAAEGSLSKIAAVDEKKKILRNAYNSQLNKDERDLYKLSATRLRQAYNDGLITDENINKALMVERQMFDNGLLESETLAKNLGLASRNKSAKSSGRKKSSGGSRRASSKKLKTTKTISLDTFKKYKTRRSSTNASLRKLLGSAKV